MTRLVSESEHLSRASRGNGGKMEISDKIQEIAIKVRMQKASIATEEGTKNAFVMPFISTVLGYDVFDPSEVIPEFIADVGIKKGEKIDYALVCDDEVQILIEVKKATEPLDVRYASQLFRYFAVTSARVAILTNGEVYEFYTDLDAPNKMDSKPFLVLDLMAVDETLLPEVAKLTKESFDIDSVVSAAGELKYIGQIKRLLAAEFREPSTEFLRLFATDIYPGKPFTQRIREDLAPLVTKATAQFLKEQVRERLKTALDDDSKAGKGDIEVPLPVPQPTPPVDGDSQGDIITTDEELEGYRIVRAIVCSEVSANRVIGRDSKTYFAVLLDDNNRKPIARLWFNRKQKYLGIFNDDREESRLAIESPEDIYQYAAQLRATVNGYPGADSSESAVRASAGSSDLGPAG
jgi:predicted type IV restriction endonuclease